MSYDVCCVLDQNKSRLSVSRLILNSVVASNWQVIPDKIGWSTNIFLFWRGCFGAFSVSRICSSQCVFSLLCLTIYHVLYGFNNLCFIISPHWISEMQQNKQRWGEVVHVSPFQFIKRSAIIFGEGLCLECPNKLWEHPAMDQYIIILSEIKTRLLSSLRAFHFIWMSLFWWPVSLT